MKRTALAHDLEIAPVISGLWQIADQERKEGQLDPDQRVDVMHEFVAAGFTTFDMADHYGSSELIAGHFTARHPTEEVQFLTKWVPPLGSITAKTTREAVDLALERLQTSSLDLLQYHAWRYSDPRWLDGLHHLNELRKEGLIKHLGVTNFDAVHLKMALDSGFPIVSNQVCHSLLDQRAAGELTRVCLQNDVKLLAFGTLAGGFFSEKWLGQPDPQIQQLDTWSQMKYKRFIDAAGGWEKFQTILQVLQGIAAQHQVNIANVASKFILDGPAVASVIVGNRLGQQHYLEQNKRTLGLALRDTDREKILEVLYTLTPIPGDCGDEYRQEPYLTASGDLSHHLDEIPPTFEVQTSERGRKKVFSGTPWESYAGYCRAIRDGRRVAVSGTTSTHGDKIIGGTDPASQTHFVIDKIEGAIQSLGGSLEDVYRTRIFINSMEDWEPIARAHGKRFANIQPANTLVQASLVGEGYLVEIEADALIK